jgi:hypothetical protein
MKGWWRELHRLSNPILIPNRSYHFLNLDRIRFLGVLLYPIYICSSIANAAMLCEAEQELLAPQPVKLLMDAFQSAHPPPSFSLCSQFRSRTLGKLFVSLLLSVSRIIIACVECRCPPLPNRLSSETGFCVFLSTTG